MGRAPRPIAAEQTYHLMVRGNDRQNIFESDHDRRTFLRLVDMVSRHRLWRHHAWCLMSNHVHLLTTTPNADLHDGMRDIVGRYSRWFGAASGRSGHLFGGRYRSVIVTDDRQLLAVVRYIANNPVVAGMAEQAADYPWSSYGRGGRGHGLLRSQDDTTVLGVLHPHRPTAEAQLRDVVEAATPSARVERRDVPSVEVLYSALGLPKAVAAAAELGYSHREIADAVGLSRSAVSQRLRRERSGFAMSR